MGNGTSKKGGAATTAPAPTGPTNRHEALAAMQAAGLRSENGKLEHLMDAMGDKNAVDFANTILDLEDRFGVSAETKLKYGYFNKNDQGGFADAHVASHVYEPGWQILRVNVDYYNESNRAKKDAQDQANHDSGWFMPKAAGVSSISYTAAHEFGHAVSNMLAQRKIPKGSYKKSGTIEAGFKKSIMSRAVKMGATEHDLSRYGKKNSAEFFAEAFANAYSGAPNKIGMAMQGWLRDQGFAKA